MEQSINISNKFKPQKIGSIPVYVFIVVFVFFLAVLQDYIYSVLQHTRFYLSESFLYNTFWAFFIPLSILIHRLINGINPKNILQKLPLNFGIGIVFSVLHIVLFSSLFAMVSYAVFTPTHHFSNICNSAFSNQFYIVLLYYIIAPAGYATLFKPRKAIPAYLDEIKLKVGSKIIRVSTANIQLISTNKPYSVIYTNNQSILDDRSLTTFETKLDPTVFLRVHRSIIVNATCIIALKSRRNGDYDATLQNGKVIRLSRHYRDNWKLVLQ